MKTLRSGVLVALVLVSAVVVVASPAFATPNLTSSTSSRAGRPDNGAVSPFITPIGTTTTNSIEVNDRYGSGSGSSFTARNALRITVSLTCSSLEVRGFAGVTHTQLTISRIDFNECKSDQTGDGATVTTRPNYFLHVTSQPAASSGGGVFIIPPGGNVNIDIGAGRCVLTVRSGSVRGTATDNIERININDRTVIFNLDRGSPTFCPDHRTNNRAEQRSNTDIDYENLGGRIRITAASPVGG
jgi:hypothetical protein